MAKASRLTARFHLWYATAWLLSRKPLSTLDRDSTGRMLYALMLARHTAPAATTNLFRHIVQRNRDTSPELTIELAAMATATGTTDLVEPLLVHAERAAESTHTRDVARTLRMVHQDLQTVSLQKVLRDKLLASIPFHESEPCILVPLSRRYLDLWQLWLRQVRTHIRWRVLVLCMDAEALTAAQDQDLVPLDLRAFFAWNARGSLHPHSRGVLWLLRTLILRELVQLGHPVLVLDLDAVPITDLAPMLASLPPADVIAQKDHSIPMDVNRELGFVLCCGFMLWQPTPSTCTLLDRFAAACAVERDDQIALNHLLARDTISDRTENGLCLSFTSANTRFVCPDPSLVSRTLHSGSVVRHFQQEGHTIPELESALGLTT